MYIIVFSLNCLTTESSLILGAAKLINVYILKVYLDFKIWILVYVSLEKMVCFCFHRGLEHGNSRLLWFDGPRTSKRSLQTPKSISFNKK